MTSQMMMPAFTLEMRLQSSGRRKTAVLLAALVAALAVSGAVLVAAGVPAGDLATEVAYTVIDLPSICTMLLQAAPLMLVGLAGAVAFRARFWNLGLEGQMIMGGVAATAMSLWQAGPESGLRLAIMGLAAAGLGALWVVVPLAMKARLQVSEIISTLLLNYIAMYFMYDLLFGPWKDPRDGYPYSQMLRGFERFPDLPGGINSAVLLSLVVAGVLLWLMQASRFGLVLKFVNENAGFARRAGLAVGTATLAAVMCSGAVAGLAGFVVTASIQGRLTQGFFQGYGFSGILIAFLARSNPALVVVISILYAMLFVMGQNLQVFFQIPFAVVQLIEAIIVIVFAASDFFLNYRLVRKG